MDRRTGGALVLVIAVIAAFAGVFGTKVIAGDARRGPVEGPPDVGSCVLDAVAEEAFVSRYQVDISVTLDGEIHPHVRTGPCTEPTYGEVVGVLADGLDYLPPNEGFISEDPGTPSKKCAELGRAFLSAGREPTDNTVQWHQAPMPSFDTIGPSEIQKRMGQRWLACRVVAYSASGGTQVPYGGTVRGAAASGGYPSEFARCSEDPPGRGFDVARIDCSLPHRSELLASASTSAPSTTVSQRLERECTDLAGTMTGMADPTAGGRLAVTYTEVAVPVYGESGAMDPLHMIDVSYACSLQVVGDGVLTGPLLGLGDGDVPLG